MDVEISIIIPVYNVEQYISKCLHSILDQTFRNFEIILIDDCSTDRSIDLVHEILDTSVYKLIKHKTNRGLSASRNSGIDIADGKYIMFIDSDDFVEPTVLEELYKAAEDHQVQMSTCNINRSYDVDGQIEKTELLWASPFKGHVQSGLVLSSLLKCEEPSFVWRHLFSKSLIGNTRFISGITMEDMFFLPYILSKTDFVQFVDKALYNYVERKGSIVKSFQPRVKEVPTNLEKMRQDFTKIDQKWDVAFLLFKTKMFTRLVSMVAITGTRKQSIDIFHYWEKTISKNDIKLLSSCGNRFLAIWLTIFRIRPGFFYWWYNWRDKQNKNS